MAFRRALEDRLKARSREQGTFSMEGIVTPCPACSKPLLISGVPLTLLLPGNADFRRRS
jgi:hypothetical protein